MIAKRSRGNFPLDNYLNTVLRDVAGVVIMLNAILCWGVEAANLEIFIIWSEHDDGLIIDQIDDEIL